VADSAFIQIRAGLFYEASRAMGPTSAAQKNQQGNTAKSDDAVVEPRRHTKRRHAIRLSHKAE